MSERGGYGQFCPVSMAAEVICTRWTTLILREFLCGSTRFNDLRRGVPKMSPALLSKRLKELEEAGVITTVRTDAGGSEYRLTAMGRELEPLIIGLGEWGHRWIESTLSLRNLDPSLLMWDMRRNLRPDPLPARRCTIQFLYPELAEGDRAWWLVVEDNTVDLCKFDPGFDVDLLISGSLRSMTSVWMGITSLGEERSAGRLSIDGDRTIARTIDNWLGLSHFAPLPRSVA
jgi:DNA-binding HxlR family transcriptional regulator